MRFDRPGFPTTKQQIAEQVFGKNFDHRDPTSVAGFYFRESGGKLVIKGDESSVHTVIVPHMTFDFAPMVEAILAQLDPIIDFTQRADEFGWVDPIFIMTPFSYSLDVYDPVADSWKTLAPIPTPGGAIGTALAGKLYVVAGTKAYVYDPGTNKWSPIVAPASPSHQALVRVVVGGRPRLLAFGGGLATEEAAPSELYTP